MANAHGVSVESALLDLASLSSVRKSAAQLLERHPRLDVLLCNAGMWSRATSSLDLTEDGQEQTLQVGTHNPKFPFTSFLTLRCKAANVSSFASANQHKEIGASNPFGKLVLRTYAILPRVQVLACP